MTRSRSGSTKCQSRGSVRERSVGPLGAQNVFGPRRRSRSAHCEESGHPDEIPAAARHTPHLPHHQRSRRAHLGLRPQGDVVSLLAYTGLRFGELTGLNVEDIDLKARRIRVRRSITQVGGRLTEGNPKSAAGHRWIPIPERLVPVLTTRLRGRPAVSRRSSRRRARGWVLRTGNAPSAGETRLRRSVGPPYACTIMPTPALCRSLVEGVVGRGDCRLGVGIIRASRGRRGRGRGSVSPRLGGTRLGAVDRLLFVGHVDVQIDVSGRDLFVSQPEGEIHCRPMDYRVSVGQRPSRESGR